MGAFILDNRESKQYFNLNRRNTEMGNEESMPSAGEEEEKPFAGEKEDESPSAGEEEGKPSAGEEEDKTSAVEEEDESSSVVETSLGQKASTDDLKRSPNPPSPRGKDLEMALKHLPRSGWLEQAPN